MKKLKLESSSGRVVFWHTSPQKNRESILANGLNHAMSGSSSAIMPWHGGPANYLWKKKFVAEEEAESRGFDLWEVRVNRKDLEDDPEDPAFACLIRAPIPAKDIKLLE